MKDIVTAKSIKARIPPFEVRSSPIHGFGAFASRRIRKGTRIIEYLGQRITNQEADARYNDDRMEHPHVLLFIVDKRTVLDAGVNGNEARYINHSCAPNCEAVIQNGRIFIEALCSISAGEELTYDYRLERAEENDIADDLRYACRCGAETCRGTMLAPRKTRKKLRR
jgi:SET domain-containing protein